MTRQAVPPRRTRVPGAIDSGYGTPNPILSLPGLVAWYDISQEVGYGGGDPITQLTDFSGNGNDAFPDVDGKRALYTAAHQNGLAVATFDGVDDQYKADYGWFVGTGQPGTIYVVCNTTFGANGSNIIWSVGTGLATDFVMVWGANNWGTHNPSLYCCNTTNDDAVIDLAGGAWLIDAATFDGSVTNHWINSALSSDSPCAYVASAIAAVPFRVSGLFNFAENNPLWGDIGEMIVCTEAHNAGTVAVVNAILAAKWDI